MDFANRTDDHRLELQWPEHWGEQRLWPPTATVSISEGAVIGGESSMTDEGEANSGDSARFLEAAATGKTRLLGQYLSSGNGSSIMRQWRNEHGMGALHLSALAGHLSCTKRLLLERGQVDDLDHESATPLMFAALGGHIKVLDILIKNGAQIGRQDADGRTALFYAVTGSHRPLVRHLLERWRPGGSAFVNRKDKHGFSALYYALNQYDLKMASLLIEHGAPIDDHWLCEASLPLVERKTALMYAAECNDLDSMSYFLDVGANPNEVRWTLMPPGARPVGDAELKKSAAFADRVKPSPGVRGKTALMYAAGNGALTCVDALLRLPRHKSVNLNAQDEHGATSLMYAIKGGNEEIIELLLRRGADPTMQDVNAMSSLAVAFCSGTSSRLLEMLVNFGCPGYKQGVELHDPLYAKSPWSIVYHLGLGASELPPTRPMPPVMYMPPVTQPPSKNLSVESFDASLPPTIAQDGIKSSTDAFSGHPVDVCSIEDLQLTENAFQSDAGGASNPSGPPSPGQSSSRGSVETNGQSVQELSSHGALGKQVADVLDVLFAVTTMPHLSRPTFTSEAEPLLFDSSLGAVLALPELLRRDQSEQQAMPPPSLQGWPQPAQSDWHLMPPPPSKHAAHGAHTIHLERGTSVRIGAWRPEESLEEYDTQRGILIEDEPDEFFEAES